jgi:hypothetical protein
MNSLSIIFYSLVCVPSQNGGFPVRLQPHKATFFASLNVNSTGAIPVLSLACEPSQNGWFAEWPHLHQLYVPAFKSIM